LRDKTRTLKQANNGNHKKKTTRIRNNLGKRGKKGKWRIIERR